MTNYGCVGQMSCERGWVDSCLSVAIPARQVRAQSLGADLGERHQDPMATVLLVEPDAASAQAYAQSLERAGFRVQTATAESESLDLAPDLVVLSVPRLGRNLLRVFARGVSVPRIVLSSEAADADRAAEFDCAAVLIRPVMYDDLVTEVRRAMKRINAHQPT